MGEAVHVADTQNENDDSNNDNLLTNRLSLCAVKYALSNEELENHAGAIRIVDSEPPTAPDPPSLSSHHRSVNLAATQPGAYSEAFGGDLERRSKVPFSLVGVAAENFADECNNNKQSVDFAGMEEGSSDNGVRKVYPNADGTLGESRPKSLAWWKRKPVIITTLMVVITAVAILIIVVVTGSTSSSHPLPTEQPQQQKDDKETTKEKWTPFVPNMTNATIMALEDPFSYQSRAYSWISKDPDWDTYEDWRKQQRYAMICLFYTFRRDNSLVNPNYFSHECDWVPRLDLCPENDEGEITMIGFSRIFDTSNEGSNEGYVTRRSLSFGGFVPPEISFLSNLKEIDIFGADIEFPPLTDVFPTHTISSMPSIKSLVIEQCQVEGNIPSTFGLLTSLTSLDLPNSSLDSTIPSQLGLLSDLETLTLSSNRLAGSIPEEIGELPSLINFNIRNNPDLQPPIPSGFCIDNRIPFESLITDWCFSPTECCGS